MPNNKDTLEEIQKALDAATPGIWNLIANDPEWLRWQQAENERLRGELDDLNERIEIQKAEIHKWKGATKEEFSCRYAAENKLEQAKTERDKYQTALHAEQKENVRLMEELSAKDKVLEWYADESAEIARAYYFGQTKLAIGERARDILSRYKRGDSQ